MNNSVFSTGIYRESLRRLRMPAIFMLIIVCIQSVFVPLILYVLSYKRLTGDAMEYVYFAEAQIVTLGGMVILVPLMINILFDFINHRNSSDFWHSLPVKRSAVYNSYLLAVLSWAAVIYGVSMLLTLFSYGMMPHVSIKFDEFWDYMRLSFILALYLLSVELLAKNIAGTKLTIFCSGAFIIFFPRGILTFIRLMIRATCNYVIMDETSLLWGNSYNLVWRSMDLENVFLRTSAYPSMESTYIYTTVMALVFIAVAGVLFVRRKSEKAEDVAVSPFMQRVLSFVPPIVFGFLPCGYIIAFIYGGEKIDGDQIVFLVLLFIIAIIVYLLYELITVRKWVAVKKAAKSLWVLFAIYAVIVGAISANIAIIRNQKPTAEEIEYVQVFSAGGQLSNKVTTEFGKIKYTDPQIKKLVADALKNEVEDEDFNIYVGRYSIRVNIHYGGRTIYRQLMIDSERLTQLLEKNAEYKKCYYEHVPDFDSILDVEVYGVMDGGYSIAVNKTSFYNALKADKAAMTPDEWTEYTSTEYSWRYETSEDSLDIAVRWRSNQKNNRFDYDYSDNCVMIIITEDNKDKFPNTYKALAEITIKENGYDGYYDDYDYREYYD